jgi:hypothetical protein
MEEGKKRGEWRGTNGRGRGRKEKKTKRGGGATNKYFSPAMPRAAGGESELPLAGRRELT